MRDYLDRRRVGAMLRSFNHAPLPHTRTGDEMVCLPEMQVQENGIKTRRQDDKQGASQENVVSRVRRRKNIHSDFKLMQISR